uniref:Titin n=1 Tax=Oryzias sinensis TaxID=183150 RepID=A0A8C7ZRA3_9TELE
MAVNQSGRSVPRESKPIVVRDSTSLPEFDLRGVCKKTVIAKAGSDIKIEIPVFGRPRPTISWQKNDTALKLTQRINVETTAATAVLNISECTRDDSGVYTILGKNIVGSVTDNIIVKIHDVPGPPKGPVQIVEISRTFCMFSWETPENDGGVPITNYVVEIRETTSQTWTELSSTVIRTMFKASRLTTGSEYQFRVKAKNRYGVPGPPSTPTVVAFTKDSITIGWNEPVSDGGNEVMGYHVERKERSSIVWHKISKGLVKGNIFKSDSGEFVLTASNAGGFAKHIFNVKVLDRPGAPLGPLTVSEITADNCVLTWSPPADDGGSKIEGYVIEKRESSRLVWTTVVSGLLVTQYKVTKLLKGNEYIFRIMASNKYGLGEPLESEPTIADNPYRIPDPPENPEVTVITKDSMVVMWQEPKNDGGTPITNFNIERKDRVGLRWVKCNKRKVKDLQFKTTGLVPGHEYEFRITAENAAGVSAPSVSSPFYKATDALYKPGPPCNPRVLDTTKSSITVAWNKPSYDGGSDISGYIVETCMPCEKEEEEEWTIVTPKDGLLTTNLEPGMEYEYRVYAENIVGIGKASQYTLLLKNPGGEKVVHVNVVVLDKPGEPQGPVVVTGIKNDQCCLAWKPPLNDGGSTVSHYIVKRRETSRLVWTVVDPKVETTSLKITKLLEGDEYIFRVYAVNQFGVGAPLESAPVLIKDPCLPPSSPKNLEVSEIKKDS